MHQALWRDGISRLSSVYDQVSIADDSTYVLVNDFSEVHLWLMWEANNGFSSAWFNGYNAIGEIETGGSSATELYGSWFQGDTDGQLCVFKPSTHGLSFRNRAGSTMNFSFHMFGGRGEYS